MPLYAVLARDYFSQSIMGTVFGAATLLSRVATALAFTFPRAPRMRLQPA
jgi:hypothetical protein